MNCSAVICRINISHFLTFYSAKTELFIAELKAVYENLCVTVIPVPFSRDEMYQVNDIFVECKLDFLIQSRQPRINEEWQPLESYREILTNSQLNSNRYIIEGDSGYGKTTLAIKMVDDWKNGSEESFFGKVKIIILIRLVQIGKTHSIFKAIKQFLLPHQSKLNIEDIQSVLRCNESVIIILDGFEEYLGKNDSTDVMRIIKAEMLEHVKVILTTRQFYLPTNMPPQTKRIRLNGFDKGTRNSYIEKVFSSDDINPSGDIKQKVKENHALEDLFQIPLFFVLFTHLSHDRRNITIFGSATSFFKHIISLFHNHTRNKIRTETLSKCKSYEKEHYKLDKLAFEVLNGTRDILWEKENICDELGCGFYDHYVNTGILVEQEVYFLNGSSNFAKTSSKILVRFCQRLFYEWYAAHHLSNLAIVQGRRLDPRHGNGQSNRNRPLGHSTDAETLKNVDPFDFQYVYRFASALNPTGAKHIYQYLSSVMGGDRFTKVCQLELQENFDQVITDVETLCSDGIVITKRHSNLGQRSTIQLLETASRHGVSFFEKDLTRLELRAVRFGKDSKCSLFCLQEKCIHFRGVQVLQIFGYIS
ncbi:hypothetical protein HOLleu_43043 [Holothuria leucospilota]|uniref:NACHT domain-containing protein n=1 Tax=Holothuria leucospilota TaxID=206669 RepID=A0A9Q0YHH6_HOLLE|nr:hypothetical protein HOLleu_43043 [Holothuria leucospilota]